MVLQIVNFNLDNDGSKALADCLRNISKLRINDSLISIQNRMILREAVQQYPNPQDLVVFDDGGEWGEQAGDQWAKTWAVYGCDEADDLKRILQLEPGKITRLSLQAWNDDEPEGWSNEWSQGTWYNELEMKDIVGYLQPHMEALNELRLDGCEQLIVDLSQAINERQNKMVLYMNIDNFNLDDDGAKALADCLRNISELRINEQYISVQNRIILREAVQQLPKPQDLVVDDDGGEWGDQDCTQWVKTWTLYENDKADDVKQILQLKPGKITRLWLQTWDYPEWYNELEMRDLPGYLQPHMEALDELRLDRCGQLIIGLSQAINKRQNKMKLGLNGNIFYKDKQLPDGVVQCLSSFLGKISELDLGYYKLSTNNSLIMQDAIEQLPSPQGFILKGNEISDLMNWYDKFKRSKLKRRHS